GIAVYKAGQVIHVTIGVVVKQAIIQPIDATGIEGLGQRLLGLILLPVVTILVEQALARAEDGALAIVIQCPAFEHKVVTGDGRTTDLGDGVPDFIIKLIQVLAAPAIGGEAQALIARHENGASVAQPNIAKARRDDFSRSAQMSNG